MSEDKDKKKKRKGKKFVQGPDRTREMFSAARSGRQRAALKKAQQASARGRRNRRKG